MPTNEEFVAGFFTLPGEDISSALLDRAAEAVERLLRVAADVDSPVRPELTTLRRLVEDHLSFDERIGWLSSPLFFEALHSLHRYNTVLDAWHRAVATPCMQDLDVPPDDGGTGCLGAILLSLSARNNTRTVASYALRTDMYGRLAFPECDWRIVLQTSRDPTQGVLGSHGVVAQLGHDEIAFALVEQVETPFLVMSRASLCRLLRSEHDGISFHSNDRLGVFPVVYRTSPLADDCVHYDPIFFAGNTKNAETTGSIVERIVASLREFSPELFVEFKQLIRVLRGFELPSGNDGSIGSFSDPTTPGVMSLNIPYVSGSPRLSPFCFTWFGHEMAHTKCYLIDTVANQNSFALASNVGDSTPLVDRYGRSLPIRTLLQIPYVHFYELQLLLDVLKAGLHLLPWAIHEDPISYGEELVAEITEGFEMIAQYALLTEAGKVAIDQQRALFAIQLRHWKRLTISTQPMQNRKDRLSEKRA